MGRKEELKKKGLFREKKVDLKIRKHEQEKRKIQRN